MNEILARKIAEAHGGSVFVTKKDQHRISLVRMGTYEEVRQRFNQMVCLIAAYAMHQLVTGGSTASHSKSAPLGSWTDRFTGKPIGDYEALFQQAAALPTLYWDTIGFQAFYGDFPLGLSKLPRMARAGETLTKLANVFYGMQCRAVEQIGLTEYVSVNKRLEEAIALAKKLGYAPFEEAKLVQFGKSLSNDAFIQFAHEIVA